MTHEIWKLYVPYTGIDLIKHAKPNHLQMYEYKHKHKLIQMYFNSNTKMYIRLRTVNNNIGYDNPSLIISSILKKLWVK